LFKGTSTRFAGRRPLTPALGLFNEPLWKKLRQNPSLNSMHYFSNAPRPLVAILTTIVAIHIFSAVFFVHSAASLLWPMLLASLSLSALFGSKKAATALKYLFFFVCAASIVMLLTGPWTTFGVARNITMALIYFGAGRYLSKSADVSEFYEDKQFQLSGNT